MNNFYSHKTRGPGFTETLYISHDQKVSFSLYWYDGDVNRIVLHNLYVSPTARRKGRASSALRDIVSSIGSKRLALYITDRKLIPWYANRGFKLIRDTDDIIEMSNK